jgi:hypothetical protein
MYFSSIVACQGTVAVAYWQDFVVWISSHLLLAYLHCLLCISFILHAANDPRQRHLYILHADK